MSKKVLKSWTQSSYETIEISHIWTISGFSLRKGKKLKSSIFSSMIHEDDGNERKLNWAISFYPNGHTEESKGHLSLFLNLINPTEEKIKVNYSFSINDDKGNCLEDSEMTSNTYYKTSNDWGYGTFCKRGEILKKLPNDIMKITCNLNYINVLQNVSGTTEEYSLQQQEEPVSSNFGTLMTDSLFSDVTLIILGEGEERTEFKAHKNILAARSPYFFAMFTHDFQEKTENWVKIKDVKPEVFKEMLTYIYTGNTSKNMNENDAKELLVAADRFALDGLKMAAKNLLVSKINVENALELLVLGHFHSAETLKTRASDIVAANLEQVMKTEGWKNMIREHPHLMEPILGAVNGMLIAPRIGSKKKTERLIESDSSSSSDTD